MSLPNPSMSFSPFAILTAEELNDMVENIEALADGSGLDDGSVTSGKLNLAPQFATQENSGTTTSTSYTATLTGTPGTNPSVTVNISSNGIALVTIKGLIQQSQNSTSLMGFAVSGANTIAANDNYAIGVNPNIIVRCGATFILTGLNPGSTTFILQYRVSGGTGTFSHRYIGVVPL